MKRGDKARRALKDLIPTIPSDRKYSRSASMALPSADPLDHHYRGEHPIRTLAYLFREDRGRLALGVLAYFVKHSPTFLLPLVTADVIDIVVKHRPISGLWIDSGILLLLLLF